MEKYLLKNTAAFILVFVLYSSGLFSQTSVYKPFPEPYGHWVVEKTGPYGPGENTQYSWIRYDANGDTTIGSYTYKKVYHASSTGNPTPIGGQYVIPYGPTTFAFAYRNDIPGKKVYLFKYIGGVPKDTLWYDFNLNIGDTLKSTYSLNVNDDPSYERSIVTSIDSVFICGAYHKRFKFNCVGWQDLGLIEGFGFEDNFLQTGFLGCPFEPVYIYHTDFSCSLTSINDRIASIKQIQLFPNPASNTLQINYSGANITLPLEYSIADCLGKIIISGTTEVNKNIDVSNLESGLYFIMVQDKEKNLYQGKFMKQ